MYSKITLGSYYFARKGQAAAKMFNHPGVCHMSGAGSVHPTTTKIIDKAESDIRDGKILDAFRALKYYIGDNLQRGRMAEALQLFAEARRMFEAVGTQEETMSLGVRIAEQGFRLGKTEEARAMLGSIVGEAGKCPNVYDRDVIRVLASITLNNLGLADEALALVGRIESVDQRFDAVKGIIDSQIKNGNLARAKETILNHGVPIGRLDDEHALWPAETKVARLAIAAEALLKIGESAEAEKIIDEAIGYLGYHPRKTNSDKLELLEKLAILLLQAGKRQKAINLLTDGWFREDYLDSLTQEQAEAEQIKLIEHLPFSEKIAIALSAVKLP